MAKTRQSSQQPATHNMRTRSQGLGPTPSQPLKAKSSRRSQPRAPRSKPSRSAPRARISKGHRNGPPKGYAYVGDIPTTVAARYALSRTSFQSLMRTYLGSSEAERNELNWLWMSGHFVRLGEEEVCPDDSIEVEVKVPESLEFLEWPKVLGLEQMVIGGTEMTAEDMEGDSDSGLSAHSDSEFVGVDL
ncbi:hypothetical protein K440DRAFT_640546 [Wilcoxina mikolae CBS 423.85]|nr:hypothetical protein K440DRAFT_640546 [Wilcoxina mikolae CBS 423.85]